MQKKEKKIRVQYTKTLYISPVVSYLYWWNKQYTHLSCNFKKLKVYGIKLYISNIILLLKFLQKYYKFINSKLPDMLKKGPKMNCFHKKSPPQDFIRKTLAVLTWWLMSIMISFHQNCPSLMQHYQWWLIYFFHHFIKY